MATYTDPLTTTAQAAPGEIGTSAQFNTYALNNIEAVATATADNIEDLEDHWGGTNVASRSGRFGIIRVGSSPFDFLSVSYDQTISRWVSQNFIYGSTGERPAETGSTQIENYVLRRTAGPGTSTYWGPLIPWRPFVTAGLIPQFRWLWAASSTGTWTVYRMMQGIDMGAEFFATNWAVGNAATGTQANPTLQGDAETAWVTNPIGGFLADYVCPGFYLANSGVTTATLWNATFLWRWVSA